MPNTGKIALRRRLKVIHNPTSGGSSNLFVATLNKLKEMNIHCDVQATQKPGEGTFIARTASTQGGYDGVVAAGGDGTCNEVARGLFGSVMPMGILPTGTANVLAIEMGLKFTATFLAQTLAFGHSTPVYLGQTKDRIFLLMAGAGFDARVVADVSKTMKVNLGKGAYVLMAIKHLFSTPPGRIEVEVEGKVFEAGWVLVCNAAHYGGRFRIAPKADLRKPGFQVLIFDHRTVLSKFASILGLILGRSKLGGGNQVLYGNRIRLGGNPGELFQIDGDVAGTLPQEISIAPSSLNLIFP